MIDMHRIFTTLTCALQLLTSVSVDRCPGAYPNRFLSFVSETEWILPQLLPYLMPGNYVKALSPKRFCNTDQKDGYLIRVYLRRSGLMGLLCTGEKGYIVHC